MENYIIYWADGTKEIYSCFAIVTLVTKLQFSPHSPMKILISGQDDNYTWNEIDGKWVIKK